MPNELQALKDKLDLLNHEALQIAERDALSAVGTLILDAIVAKAPARTEYDGGDLKPGELKESFRSSVHLASDIGVLSNDHDTVTVKPIAKVAHIARFVENGHANRPGSKNPNTPAHPFVRPAFAEVKDKAIDLYASMMTDAITKAMQ